MLIVYTFIQLITVSWILNSSHDDWRKYSETIFKSDSSIWGKLNLFEFRYSSWIVFDHQIHIYATVDIDLMSYTTNREFPNDSARRFDVKWANFILGCIDNLAKRFVSQSISIVSSSHFLHNILIFTLMLMPTFSIFGEFSLTFSKTKRRIRVRLFYCWINWINSDWIGRIRLVGCVLRRANRTLRKTRTRNWISMRVNTLNPAIDRINSHSSD